jgi:TonB-dependent receptor
MAAASWLAIGAALACTPAFGQSGVAQTPAQQASTVSDVIVVGVRASQQSSIDRKKKASTPTDSIVADDVGSFPDRNINEAISRVAGTALSRNDYGEGEGVSIRGNSPEFTRVELDGIGVQSAGGSVGTTGETGRGADMRELPADLIKSVDIIKGSTADMTEGSLGGSVKITTRSGLDFKKPYLSFRLGTTQNDLGEKYGYDVNLIASRKFLDNRLGAIFSVTASQIQNDSHQMQTVTSGNAGYARSIDWDNSPDKTFEYNPDLVNGDTADTVLANSDFTPRQIAALSAAAQTKADCLTAFPRIIDPQANPLGSNQSSSQNNRKNERFWEQQSCLNQWNDYHPSLIRSFLNTQLDERLAADLRLDYQVTDSLKVYAKYSIANRKVDDQTRNRNLGGVNINPGGFPLTTFDDPTTQQGFDATGNPGIINTGIINRTGGDDPSIGTWTYMSGQPTAMASRDVNPASNVTRNYNFPVYGMSVNVDPASVVVDDNHHVTQFTAYNLSTGIDQISNKIDSKSSYAQLGAEYWEGPLRVEFVANRSESSYSRQDKRTSRSFDYGALYGAATLSVQPSGLWSYELPQGYDETDPNNFVLVTARDGAQTAAAPSWVDPDGRTAYTAAQRALTSASYLVSYQPRADEGEETALKLDVTYDLRDKSTLLTRLKTGVSYRDASKQWWGPGGYQVSSARGTYDPTMTPEENIAAGYVPPVTVPTLNQRGAIRACTPAGTGIEPTSGQPYEPCDYGFLPATGNPASIANANRFELQGVTTITEAELRDLVASTVLPPESTFFDDYPGAGGLASWNAIDVEKFFAASGQAATMNLDCLRRCMGSDGNMYDQPLNFSEEKVLATYAMLDFEHDLPFGMSFDGNVGLRRVQTKTSGSATLQFRSIRRNDPNDPTSPTTTYDLRRPFTFTAESIDILPSYNLSLWLIEDKLALRGYTAKTITRPPLGRLIPGGMCTIDERNEGVIDPISGEENDQSCGRLGNPGLEPYQAQDYNASVEWYPNRDTMFSLAWHKLDVNVGGPIGVTRQNYKVFAGTGAVDPETGASLEDTEFTVPTWENGPGFQRTGLEFTSKTAFTFLPWLFRHTGADFNYSKLKSSDNVANIDPITGEGQPQAGESAYFANLSLWYDDGRLNARVSFQNKGESFVCISACNGANTVNNLPIGNPGELARVPYNPGEPNYRAETKFVDAKISYKLRPNIEVYAEGRNLTQEANVVFGSERTGFADGTPNLWSIGYGGRRYMFGIVYRYGAG